MEITKCLFQWLEWMDRPAFCVEDGMIVTVNTSAKQYMIQENTRIEDIVTNHMQSYMQNKNGTLFLNITVGDQIYNACVKRFSNYDLFFIDSLNDDISLQSLSLAAQQLRTPLSSLISVASAAFSDLGKTDIGTKQKISQMNRNLFQLMRIISNMSDAKNYQGPTASYKENVNFTALFGEIMEKIQTLSQCTNKKISYTGLDFAVIGLANEEQIERAVYNLISNALKFSPICCQIDTNLTLSGDLLSFTVCNPTTEPISDHIFWHRYHRTTSMEESNSGLGLGMTLISSVAYAHNGTLLIDHPKPLLTRITMTMPIIKSESNNVRAPILRFGDYAGGWDKVLLELSEILPADSYDV